MSVHFLICELARLPFRHAYSYSENILIYPQIIQAHVGCCQQTRNSIWYWLDCYPDSAVEKESYQGELFERAALAVDVGPAIWRTSRWSMKGTVRPGKANFQPFSTMQSSETNVVQNDTLERTEVKPEEICGYLPNLRHLLTHRDRYVDKCKREKRIATDVQDLFVGVLLC